MSDNNMQAPQEFEYKAEMRQLLHLIIHSLYTHPEVFLRELISNASDALNKIRFRMLTDRNVIDPEADLKIMIELDAKEKLFAIEDTGIGMTRDDLIDRIGTVASSGTLEFFKQMKEQEESVDANLIGQFGVGFYSCFMVAEEVVINTRHADPDSLAYRWQSDGGGKFTIAESDRQARGTRIEFKLKENATDFSMEYHVKNIITRYSNFVDFPIFVGKEKVNTVQALWHRSKDQISEEELSEFYKFVSNEFAEPLGHLPLAIEGVVNFKALLFIPSSAPLNWFRGLDEKTVHLYSNKVFIQDDCKELLPEYLRFVKGVVDTEDLPLNVSREVTQSSPQMTKIRNTITKKLLGLLEEWAEKEKSRYERFFRNFGPIFKTGINSDMANREKLIELLRFESTKTAADELTSLHEYVGRMKTDQKEIYYLTGESRELIQRNPNLEYFKKNDLEVLLLSDPTDIIVIPSIDEFDKKPIKSIEKADIDLQADTAQEDTLADDLAKSLLLVFKQTLGDKVEDVIASKRLVDSPATLVIGKDGFDPQMERMMKAVNRDFSGSKRIFEVNMAHPLIRNLSRLNLMDSTHPKLRNAILQLYHGALLLEGNLPSPAEFIARMNEFMEDATKSA